MQPSFFDAMKFCSSIVAISLQHMELDILAWYGKYKYYKRRWIEMDENTPKIKTFDYQPDSERVKQAWNFLDGLSDEELVQITENVKDERKKKCEDKIIFESVIISILQELTKRVSGHMTVTTYADSLHIELITTDSVVLDPDDLMLRVVLGMAKGFCIDADTSVPGQLHFELDYEKKRTLEW